MMLLEHSEEYGDDLMIWYTDPEEMGQEYSQGVSYMGSPQGTESVL